jgi:hypothetical protein
MAAAGPNFGYGLSITFSSGFFAYITNVDWDGINRPAIDTSNNSISTAAPFRTFIPAGLIDTGSISVELLFDANADLNTPIKAAATTVTVTFPKFGFTTAPTWAASGFMTDFKIGAPMDDKMTASATIKFSGAITVTAGS